MLNKFENFKILSIQVTVPLSLTAEVQCSSSLTSEGQCFYHLLLKFDVLHHFVALFTYWLNLWQIMVIRAEMMD